MDEKRKSIAQLSVEAVRLQMEGKSASHIFAEIRERQQSARHRNGRQLADVLTTGMRGGIDSALQVTTRWPKGSRVAVDRSVDDVIVLRLITE